MIPMRSAIGLLLFGATLALFGATWIGLDPTAQRSTLVVLGSVSLALLGLDYIEERRR